MEVWKKCAQESFGLWSVRRKGCWEINKKRKVYRRLWEGCKGPLVLLLESKGDAFISKRSRGQQVNNFMENTEIDSCASLSSSSIGVLFPDWPLSAVLCCSFQSSKYCARVLDKLPVAPMVVGTFLTSAYDTHTILESVNPCVNNFCNLFT